MSQKRNRAITNVGAESQPVKRGRPIGSMSREYATGQASPSSCPACRSTRSHVLRKMTTVEQAGTHQGQPYNLVDLHRVQCNDCGQCRIDRTYKFEPPAA